ELHDRSLLSQASMADFDGCSAADPHSNGTIWASALWDLRAHLDRAEPDGARTCDRLAVQTLLTIGRRMGDEHLPTVKGLRRARRGFGSALPALLESDERLHQGGHRELILQIFAARGFVLARHAEPSKPAPRRGRRTSSGSEETTTRRALRAI